MSCISCARGFHEECNNEPCCCTESRSTGQISFSDVPKKIGRPPKADEELGISAGRKRAAEIYKDEMGEDKPCEWRGLANCGGGKFPVLGCIAGTRTDIHHGPVKATHRNERSNISLICSLCHNKWHGANDKIYVEDEFEKLPKHSRLMSQAETMMALEAEKRRKAPVELD